MDAAAEGLAGAFGAELEVTDLEDAVGRQRQVEAELGPAGGERLARRGDVCGVAAPRFAVAEGGEVAGGLRFEGRTGKDGVGRKAAGAEILQF